MGDGMITKPACKKNILGNSKSKWNFPVQFGGVTALVIV